jgi:hypothetical protein
VKKVGYVPLPDGRRVCVEVDHKGAVRATLIYDGDNDLTWPNPTSTISSRHMSASEWDKVQRR